MAQTETVAIEVAAKTGVATQAGDPWSRVLRVPAVISIEVGIVGLTVRELFRLEKGSIVATSQSSGANVPVLVGRRLIAWGEFQVTGELLAVRIAELT